MEQLAILPGLASAPRTRRVCCPTCRRPLDRLAARRATATRRAMYEAAWAAWFAADAERAAIVVEVAHEVAKRPRPTMDAVWVEVAKRTGGLPDHNWRAAAARHLMRDHAALAGRFTVRDTAGNPGRRAA